MTTVTEGKPCHFTDLTQFVAKYAIGVRNPGCSVAIRILRFLVEIIDSLFTGYQGKGQR
jgi:hypothetical protein